MAGGTFTVQNKVRPGVYINFESVGQSLGTLGERGIAAIALPLPWGAPKVIQEINAGDDVFEKLGYDITAPVLLLVKEALKRTRTLLLYRLNTGTKATVTVGTLTATAKYGGVRGNDLKIVIQTNIDDPAKFDVITLVSNTPVDLQTVSDISGLTGNAWIDWSGTGTLTSTAGAALTGGADGTVTNQDHSDFLAALELYEFNTAAYAGTDATLKGVYASFAKRLRDDEGRKIQVVMENYPIADYEGVISVKNGVILADGTALTAAQAVAWVAGATAAAAANQSLTYSAYDDAVDANPRYTNSQIIAALKNGEFLFTLNNARAIVEQDINTFKSFTPTKGKHFRKNRALRALDGLANEWKRTYETYYIGKVDNDADGRNLFRKECVKIAGEFQGIRAIQNFDAQNDVRVAQGEEADAVFVDGWVQPVDAIEKVYMKVRVR
ncbi:phage tail sheath family protein [Paenibacillus naphthalenovorans]|uniref:phage tail sheath family protein n=1 Tax=Paenibacillus naphthalenovorans TaxID=162209 RepID=UPI003D27A057